MSTEIRRKDKKNRVLKKYEIARKTGGYEYKYPIGDGKRRSIYAQTLEELRVRERQIERDMLDGMNLDNNLTLNQVYEKWIRIKRGLRDTTFQNYKYMYDMFVSKNFGCRKITSIKKSDVRAFYNHLNEVRGLALSTIDSVHTVLHQVFELAVEDELIRLNPSDKALMELKRSSKRGTRCKEIKPRALTVPEMMLFEDFLNTDKRFEMWQPVFMTMLWTGMRVGELGGLTWEDIDFDNNLIHVQRNLVYYKSKGDMKSCFAIHSTKTEAGDRFIPILPQVREALLKQKTLYSLTGIKNTLSVDGISDFVFINRFGRPFNQECLNRHLGRIMQECNFKQMDSGKKDPVLLPPLTNHWLRHTFVTRCIEAGIAIKVVQSVVGHKDIETTLDIYTDVTNEFRTKEMANLTTFVNRFREERNESEDHEIRPTVVRPIYDNTQNIYGNC